MRAFGQKLIFLVMKARNGGKQKIRNDSDDESDEENSGDEGPKKESAKMISVKYEFNPLTMEEVENLPIENNEGAKPSTTSNKDKSGQASQIFSKGSQKQDEKVKINYDDPEYQDQWRFSRLSERSPSIEASPEGDGAPSVE